MKALMKLKPIFHVLGFFIILIFSFFISIPIDTFITKRYDHLHFFVPALFFMLPIAFWIYYVGYFLDIVDRKTNNKRGLKIYILSIALILLGNSMTMILTNYYKMNQNEIPFFYTLLITLAELYGLIYICRYTVTRFALYYNKRNVRAIDYIGYLIILSIIPLGIGMIQSQIRTIMIDEDIK